MDLHSLRSSLKQRLEDGPQTLKDLNFSNIEQTDNHIIVDTSDWYYRFNILAIGDFNNDGMEELLIEFIDQAKPAVYKRWKVRCSGA